MLKHFTDRQLVIDPKVLEFMALRIDRSMEAAAAAVEAVDRAALRSGRKISRQLVADTLEVPED
jgi:chromosomal replication initiation ATPase DnaA